MSYAAKGDRIFSYRDPTFPDCTPPAPKRSDHRLKRFQSTLDKRAWNFCEEVRGKHFLDLMTGSRTCLIDSCHKYVPLDDLINILMAAKDQLIRVLEEKLRVCCQERGDTRDTREEDLLRNQVAGLTEEVNKSRDMLRKAMHKLQNIDEIVNENKTLQCRLRCSEERVKFLEEKKKDLETQLAELRSKSQILVDLENAQRMLNIVKQRQESAETDEEYLQCLASERDQLQEKVKKLESELEESKKREAEIEILKKQSQSDSLDKEEMSRENECYRKKLASMKCLEKQIQELKKQGRALADKYKKESQKAAEQMRQMCQAAKELQGLREERDSLRKRVNELASYECQYNKLQRKLQRVDAVIAENEKLNCKLLTLQKMEKENEYLKCRLEAMQEMEMTAAEDKERIAQLQCAVADQEEEMKDLLCQIERLTDGKHEEELERLKCELYEKNSKLKLCEEQLAEIPMLEAEIDELRMKLQCCCREFPEKKKGENSYQKVEVRFPATSTGIRVNYKTPGEKSSSVIGIRREEKVALKDKHGSCQEIMQTDSRRAYKITSEVTQKKDQMSCEEVQCLLQSSKGIISCVLEDMIEHQKEMEELEMCNRAMKEEIETLKAKVGGSDKDCLLQEINCLKKALEEKDLEISRLQSSGARDGEDIETIKELNRQMKAELEAACVGLKQVANLEKMLEQEHKARCEAERKLRSGGPSRPVDVGRMMEEDPEFDCCKALQRETEDLKMQIEALNRLTAELKKENELLRELQQPCPDFSKELDEKCALENLLSLLQAELDAFKGQKLSDECEALRNELKRVMEQNCQLKALVDCYRQRLDLEKKSNELNQMKAGTPGGADRPSEAEDSGGRPPGYEISDKELKSPDEDDKKWKEDDEGKPGGVKEEPDEEGDETLKKEKTGTPKTEVKVEPSETKYPAGDEKPGSADSGVAGKPDVADSETVKKPEMADSETVKKPEMADSETVKKPKMADSETVKKPEMADSETVKKPEMADSETVKKPEMADSETVKKPDMADSGVGKKPDAAETGIQRKSETADMGVTTQPATVDAGTTAAALAAAEKEKADCMKELEQLRREKDDMAKQLAAALAGEGKPGMADAGTIAEAVAAAEKEKADCLNELEQLRYEKNALAKELADALAAQGKPATADAGVGAAAAAAVAAAEKEKSDCLKELEQLRYEKNALAKELADALAAQGKPATADAGVGAAAAAAVAAAEKEKSDCLKELEKLKNENNELNKQLAAAMADAGKPATADAGVGAAAAAAVAAAEKEKSDCLKELEKLKNENNELNKQLAAAMAAAGKPGGVDAATAAAAAAATAAADKEKADCLKELEKLRNENKDLAKQLAAAPGGFPDRADLLKEIEQLKREKNDFAQQLAASGATATAATGTGAPDDWQARLRQMEAENAEKLRKLMEQHEKELADREKTYNENLTSMKTGYETDIRKLAERHKLSIMRLQELHEDEVQEMNVNYETQLDTMQTQSQAAINDVAQGSAAKMRKLAEHHSREMKDAEQKFHVALDEKESEYLEQLLGLRDTLAKSRQELETLKKKAARGPDAGVDQLKAQQAREIQKIRRTSKQKVDSIKKTLEEERKKSEAEIESLKKQIQEQGKGEEVCQCKYSKKRPPKPRDPSCPLDFNEVLEKILEEGLDSLTFNEVALVHRKTCCALEGIVLKSNTSALLELEPPIGDGCPHTPLLEADKQQLLSRIFSLENAILQKQRQTQEAIISMELAIKKERCRLQEVRNSLQNEQQKNSELKLLLSSQTKLQTDLKKERDKMGSQASMQQSLCQEKMKQLDEEKRNRKCLEAEVEKLKSTLKQLCMNLDVGRGNTDFRQADQIEIMRSKLEQAVHQERRLALQLENETKCRMQLQCQLQTLRQSLKNVVNLPAVGSAHRLSQNPLEAKSAKDKKNLDQINEKRNKMKTKSVRKVKK